jgi:hypothetical protein
VHVAGIVELVFIILPDEFDLAGGIGAVGLPAGSVRARMSWAPVPAVVVSGRNTTRRKAITDVAGVEYDGKQPTPFKGRYLAADIEAQCSRVSQIGDDGGSAASLDYEAVDHRADWRGRRGQRS